MRNVSDLLKETEAELMASEAEVLARLEPIRQELEKVRTALIAIGHIPAHGAKATRDAVEHWRSKPPIDEFRNFTMKQLVRKALAERFTNGATAHQLLDYFHDEWGRTDIIRSSLSPQLSRLKREGLISLHGLVWHLLKEDDTERSFESLLGNANTPHENEPSTGKPEDGSETALGRTAEGDHRNV